MAGTPQDYLVGFAAAKEWCRDRKIPMNDEALEILTEVIIDAVDNARAKRQQEH